MLQFYRLYFLLLLLSVKNIQPMQGIEEVPLATTPRCAAARLDLVFVLDASTILTEPNSNLMKKIVKDFLLDADIDGGNVRVGVVIYSDADYVLFQLNDYSKKAYVYNAIDAIPYLDGGKNTADALRTMRSVMFTLENGDRPGVDNVAVVVTGGVSNINSRRTAPEAEQARAEGIHIYAIGIGLTDTKELDGIASKPVDEYRFVVQDLTELRGLRQKVFSALCKCFLQEDNTCTVKCPYKPIDRQLVIYTL